MMASGMNPITERFLESALETARVTKADALLVYADVFPERSALHEFIERAANTKVVLATRYPEEALEVLPIVKTRNGLE